MAQFQTDVVVTAYIASVYREKERWLDERMSTAVTSWVWHDKATCQHVECCSISWILWAISRYDIVMWDGFDWIISHWTELFFSLSIIISFCPLSQFSCIWQHYQHLECDCLWLLSMSLYEGACTATWT